MSSAYRQRQQLQRHSIFLDFHVGCPLDMKEFLLNFFGALSKTTPDEAITSEWGEPMKFYFFYQV